ncbi:MAG: OsmC family protein [Anaerolineales bacterium]
MDAKVIWNQNMSFTGSATSGFKLPLDADPGAGGADSGFRPLELLAVGLAGCTAMDVISVVRKKRQDVTAFEVLVAAQQQSNHPHVFTTAQILYRVTGHSVDEAAVLRAIELSALQYCPAQAMLTKAFPMELVYEIYEDQGDGKTQLVKQGQWKPATG